MLQKRQTQEAKGKETTSKPSSKKRKQELTPPKPTEEQPATPEKSASKEEPATVKPKNQITSFFNKLQPGQVAVTPKPVAAIPVIVV